MRKAPPWIHSYPGDVELAQHIGMDGFTLVRLRRHVYRQYAATSGFERAALVGANLQQRWGWLIHCLDEAWPIDLTRLSAIGGWLGLVDEEWFALLGGHYPVSVCLVERTSALLGISEEFLWFGTPPAPATYLIESRQASKGGTA